MKATILSLVLLSTTLVGGVALAIACNNDPDCPCGDVCSWATSTHTCVAADGGSPGWCGTGNTNCLYQGQTCNTSMNMCMPAWTPSSVCLQGTATDGGTGSGSGGGGCSSAPGEVGWGTLLVAVGLLLRSRRRTA
jgi:uncharacterized protein (TIGR03382 family)